MAKARYDTIGRNYSEHRYTEPTWAAEISDALGDATTVLNVGAGTGNYEAEVVAAGRTLVALEPSMVMLAQRPHDAEPVTQAVAEALPFADDAFDATMGVLTMHHWPDRDRAIGELARVAPRHVYTLYESVSSSNFWLIDYFPETRSAPMELNAPTAETLGEAFDVVDVRTLWVPRDCREGFAAGSWARPHDYLNPEKQEAISVLALADPDVRRRGTEQLRADLESGAWYDKYPDMATQERADFGYRLVIAERR